MNKIFGIGIIIVALIGITSGVLLVQRQQQLKSQAAISDCTQSADGRSFWEEPEDVINSFQGAYSDNAEAEWISQNNANLAQGAPRATDGQTLFTQDCSIIYQYFANFGPNGPQQWVDAHNAEIGSSGGGTQPPPPPPPQPPPPPGGGNVGVGPPPPPGSQCTANEVVRQGTHCVGQQMCTYNVHHRSDCSEYNGGDYGCQNDAKCGFTQPPPPPPGGNVGVGTGAGACRDNPETPPAGFKWDANCNSSGACTSNSQCPKGANNQDGWCYGFEDGFRCMKLVATGGSPSGGVPPPPPPPPSTAVCPISTAQNYSIPTLKQLCTLAQQGQFTIPVLVQFGNPDLIAIGNATGNLGNFLSDFPIPRLVGRGLYEGVDYAGKGFGMDILVQLKCSTIIQMPGDIQIQITQAGKTCSGGTPPPPPSDGLPRGSECVSMQVIDPAGQDVTTTGPVYESGPNEKYVIRLTFKNKDAAGVEPWTKATHRLQAMGNTAALWGTQTAYPLVKDTVTKDNIEVFNIDATALPLAAGKNFEERPFHYSMADATGPFGALCERNVTVLKKPAGLVTTKCYVISEDATEVDSVTTCDDPKARTYSVHPTNITYPFKTPLVAATPRTIYVKFFDSNNRPSNNGTPITKKIVYIPPAAISGIDCVYDPTGQATLYTIKGNSFGTQTANTKVKVGNLDATIIPPWTDSQITAKVDQRLEGSNNVQISLDDGKKLDLACAVGVTTATLSVKNKCATSETLDTSDVEVSIFENSTQPIVKQKVRPDRDGLLTGFAPKLERNKNYTALFKKPGFLTKKVVFNTTSQTAAPESAVLIPGDIAPATAPDNVINSFDFSELKTQWNLVKDVTRTGDLNKDGRVNSFDWSCMKSSSNLPGDVFTGASTTAPPPSTVATSRLTLTGKVFLDNNNNKTFDQVGDNIITTGAVTISILKVPDTHVIGQNLTAQEVANSQVLGQTSSSQADGSYTLAVNVPTAGGMFSLVVNPGGAAAQGGQLDFRLTQPVQANLSQTVDIPVRPTVAAGT